MADVKPFRALRYDEAAAGPLETLVAPPYDVISPSSARSCVARSPYNVVHLTLPDSRGARRRATLAAWRERGRPRRGAAGGLGLEQDYVGPDGVARTRVGLVASLKVEPYERGTVLPHERTHAGPKEGRLRLLRATRAQLEPIFLLYDGAGAARARPTASRTSRSRARELWRLDDPTRRPRLRRRSC